MLDHPRAPSETAKQTCPTCTLPALHAVTHTERGISSADLICPMDHIWRLTWMAA